VGAVDPSRLGIVVGDLFGQLEYAAIVSEAAATATTATTARASLREGDAGLRIRGRLARAAASILTGCSAAISCSAL
jgi:hypothetical protein